MSIADFLFSSAAQNILRLCYASPDRSFMLKELLARAGSGVGNGVRQVDGLIKAGVLQEEPRAGHQRSIRVNTEFPLYAELQSICMKSFGIREPIREALLPFAAQITEAFVFGSVATGRDTHLSDIDVMVVGDADLIEVTGALMAVEPTLGRPIHLNMYAPEEWADLRKTDHILRQIAASTIIRILPDLAPGSSQP